MTCTSYIQSGPALLAALVLASTGCDRTSVAQTQAQATPAAADRPLDRVTAGPPVRKTLELYTTQPGRLEAFETTPLAAKVAGYVEEILVDIGDRVKGPVYDGDVLKEPGQPLIEIDIPEMEKEHAQKLAAIEQAKSEIKQAQAAIKVAQAMRTSAEALVGEAQASIERANADYERRKIELARFTDLASRQGVTEKLVDESTYQFRAAEAAQTEAGANVLSAKAAWEEALANVKKAGADQVAAEARGRVARRDREAVRRRRNQGHA